MHSNMHGRKTKKREIKKIGSGSYSRVDDALEKLYNIKGW